MADVVTPEAGSVTTQAGAAPTQLSADQLNPAVAPGATEQVDAGFLQRKLELQASDLRAKGEANARKDKEIADLQAKLKAQQDQAAVQKAANLEKQGQFEPLWKDALKANEAKDRRIVELEAELDAERTRNATKDMTNDALSAFSGSGAVNPSQLVALVQAQYGFRRDEQGRTCVVSDGLLIPVSDFSAQTKQDASWQHHYAAAGARGMAAGANATSTVAPGLMNPWKKDSWNRTEQKICEMQNPALAEAFRAEAARG